MGTQAPKGILSCPVLSPPVPSCPFHYSLLLAAGCCLYSDTSGCSWLIEWISSLCAISFSSQDCVPVIRHVGVMWEEGERRITPARSPVFNPIFLLFGVWGRRIPVHLFQAIAGGGWDTVVITQAAVPDPCCCRLRRCWWRYRCRALVACG